MLGKSLTLISRGVNMGVNTISGRLLALSELSELSGFSDTTGACCLSGAVGALSGNCRELSGRCRLTVLSGLSESCRQLSGTVGCCRFGYTRQWCRTLSVLSALSALFVTVG